jgi:hypothetical protein
MHVIGLAGKAGSGKDTIGGLIADLPRWQQIAFADPLRVMLVMGGFAKPEQLNDRKLKETPIELHGASPRLLMQTLGTEWGREMIHPEIWIRLLAERVDKFAESGVPGVVITDIRFEDEAEYVRRVGGRVVHVIRPPSAFGLTSSKHRSEAGIKRRYGDFLLDNDGMVADLPDKLQALMQEITGKKRWPYE